jgi:hypothetical protein
MESQAGPIGPADLLRRAIESTDSLTYFESSCYSAGRRHGIAYYENYVRRQAYGVRRTDFHPSLGPPGYVELKRK